MNADKDILRKVKKYRRHCHTITEELNHLSSLILDLCDGNAVLISLNDEDQLWPMFHIGLECDKDIKDTTLCQRVIKQKAFLMVEDILDHQEFGEVSLFIKDERVRFYAGTPLVSPEGHIVGAVCTMNQDSKTLCKRQIDSFNNIASLIVITLEKSLEKAKLDHLKNQYEDVQSMCLTGGWELDLQTNKTFWSKGIYQIHGIPMEKSLDKVDAISFYAPHERDRLGLLIQECAENGVEFDSEFEFYDAQRNKKWVRSIGKPVYEEDGSIKKIIGTFQDVTVLRENQMLIVNRERKLRQLFEQSRDANMTLEPPHWVFTSGNAATLELFKVASHDDFIKLGPWDISPEVQPCGTSSGDKAKKMISLAMEKGTSYFEWTHCTTEGEDIPCTVVLSRIEEDDKVYLHASIRDISEQKELERELNSSYEYLDLALEGAGLGVWDWDLINDSVKFDKRWTEMLGIDHDTVKMDISTWRDRVHPDDLPSCYKDIENYMSGKTTHYENIHRTKHEDGRWLYILGKGRFSKFDKEGNPVRFTGTNLDITEKIEMEKALGRNAKLASIGQLAAGVGHEINNPLTVIKGYVTSILKKDKDISEYTKSVLTKISVASNRIANIVDGLRTFARVEQDSDSSIFHIKPLLYDMENMLKEIYMNEGVNLEFHFDELAHEVCLSGDRGKFEQIIINLISNAKDASEGKSERLVKVTASYEHEEVVLTVCDNGQGVPDDLKEKIFDPFFTTKPVGKGTGIGLSLVHKFISNDFKGNISIEKSGVDEGSTFKIVVPAVMSDVHTDQVSATVNQSFNLKAIIVEDEEEIRKLLEDMLSDLGIEIFSTGNGAKALEELRKNPCLYDLVVSDMTMPEMDGLTLLKKIREDTDIRQPKFFFTSGGVNINFEDKDNDVNKLIDGHFYKPFIEEKIIKLLKDTFSIKI